MMGWGLLRVQCPHSPGMEEWLTRRTGSIATSHLVTQHRKRRAAFE